jgi:hypothetical protein
MPNAFIVFWISGGASEAGVDAIKTNHGMSSQSPHPHR